MKRRIVKFVLFLLLGAIFNFAVAVTISVTQSPELLDGDKKEGATRQGPSYFDWSVSKESTPHAVRILSWWHDEGTFVHLRAGWQMDPADPIVPAWARRMKPGFVPPSEAHNYGLAWEYGWPTRSFGGEIVMRERLRNKDNQVDVDRYLAIPIGQQTLRDPSELFNVRLVALRPLWPGFAINTAFYAAILWLLFAIPFTVRRWRRIKRGSCPNCAYDLRGSTSQTCPECGKAVRV